jgi:rhodanese-related sulfurtransferase
MKYAGYTAAYWNKKGFEKWVKHYL